MTEETLISRDPRDSVKLKYIEQDVSPEQPWQDDELGREQIAERLTKLIRNQREPFIISIDGQWGTGKTFLLKRWQKDLERDEFRAIYFNAWEDDFCDDPLLSIIGQLSEHFKVGKLEVIARKVGQTAVLLIKKNVIGVISKQTGLVLEWDQSDQDSRNLLKEYLDQRETKDRLKKHLSELSAAVAKETQRPLVFIIDELDRCRPTFAIELLERVKHIFDIPNMVFVFGINRDELCKSLKSVYGEIDAGVYLRRFFDMEFALPQADSKSFCTHTMTRFGLHEFFQTQSRNPLAATNRTDYENLSQAFPTLCSLLELSLRDIVYSTRLVVLAIRNLSENQNIYPWPLSVLIPLKLNNPTLFRQFIQGDCHASDVMNYIDGKLSHPIEDRRLSFELTAIEADLYLLETARLAGNRESTPWHQLELLAKGSGRKNLYLLSERTQEEGSERASELLRSIDGIRVDRTPRNAISVLAGLIDFHDTVVR